MWLHWLERLRGIPILRLTAARYKKELTAIQRGARSTPRAIYFRQVAKATQRHLGIEQYDSQWLAGMAMDDGMIAQLATGEGKTLAAVAPACWQAEQGRHVHILTVNDYLARRDAAWMKPIYQALGKSVGVIQEDSTPAERRAAYRCDITYVTAKELGFDFLRDQLVSSPDDRVQHRLGAS